MAWRVIPLSTWPDQDIAVTIEVSGKNIPLKLHIRWNFSYRFWFMSITDGNTNELLIDSLPLVTGEYPAANLLEQYQHLNLGSAIIVPASELVSHDYPLQESLGTEFVLMWGDGEL